MNSKRHSFLNAAATMLVVALAAGAGAGTPVKDHTRIQYPPLPELKVERPEQLVLDNGLRLFLLEDHELPLIDVRVIVRTGSDYEPADKVGLAGLMATVQRTGGTARMTGDEIDEFLALRAASVETGMSGDSGSASMSCLKDDFDEVFRVLADVLRTPRFDAEKLEVAKVQANASIARRNDSIGSIVSREFAQLVYGEDSPLARDAEYETIAAIERDDLVAFHARYYRPGNVYVGIVGDFDAETMKDKVRKTLADWKGAPAAELPEPAYRKTPNPGVFFVEKGEVTQANIRIGHLGIERKNPDYFAVQVMNEILSGSFASRLFSNVRSDKGLAYNVSGGVGAAYGHPGLFQVGMQTKSGSMGEAVDALMEEIRGIIEIPPTPEEMSRAKEAILESFVFNYTSKRQILSQQMSYAYYGQPVDYLERYRANIEKVSAEDVRRVARTYVHPDRLTLLVVGKSEDFDRPLSSFGEVATVDITIPPPPETTPEVARTTESVEAGGRILARAVNALGGPDPATLHALRRVGNMTLSMGGQTLSLGREVLVVFPDKVRMSMKTPMGDQVVVIDGDTGFALAAGQVQDLPAERVADAAREIGRDLTFVVRYHDDPGLEAVAAGQDEVDGTRCDVVAVTLGDNRSRWCVADDGRVLRQAYQGEHPVQRTPGRIELLFSDYRDVEGLRVPYVQVMKFDGEEVMRVTVESVEINPEIRPDAFDKPDA